jgi:O-antigen ligase
MSLHGFSRTPSGGLRRRQGQLGSVSGLSTPSSRGSFDLNLLTVGLFLFIVISVSVVHGYVGILRIIRVGLLLWLVVLGSVLVLPKKVRWRNLFDAWPPKAVLALAVLACLSVPFSLSVGGSGAFLVETYLRVVTLFVVLVIAIRTVGDLSLFVWAMVVSTAVLGVLSLTVMNVTATHGGTRIEATSMYDANDVGLILLCGIPLALILFETSRGPARWVSAASLAVMASAIAITGSRGAFVGMMVVVPTLVFVMSHVSLTRRLGAVLVLAVGLVVGAPDGYWDRISSIFSPGDDYNVTDYYGRVETAKRGVGYMLQYPLVGVGIDNFPRAEGTISPLAQRTPSGEGVRFIAPHNTYVQVGAELGIPALLIWLSMLWAGTVGVWRLRPVYKARIASGHATYEDAFLHTSCTYFPVSMLAFAITSYFTSHAYTPVFYILAALLSGIFVLHRRHQGSSTNPGEPLRVGKGA